MFKMAERDLRLAAEVQRFMVPNLRRHGES
jgi:hypothetical protein